MKYIYTLLLSLLVCHLSMAQYIVYDKIDTIEYKGKISPEWENISLELQLNKEDSIRLHPHSGLSICLDDDLFVCDTSETNFLSGFRQMTIREFAKKYRRWTFSHLYEALQSTIRAMGQHEEDDIENVVVYDRNQVIDILDGAVRSSQFSIAKDENSDSLLLSVPKRDEILYFDVLIEYYSRSEGTFKFYFPFQEREQNISLGDPKTVYKIPMYGMPTKQEIKIYILVSPDMFLIGEYEKYVKLCSCAENWRGKCFLIDFKI